MRNCTESDAPIFEPKKTERNYIDITGQTFGELTVISMSGKTNSGERTWLCKCKCGNTKEARGSNLRSGGTKSCGCLMKGRVPGSDGKIPEELRGVESVTLKDGAFEVFKNGRIFRNHDFGKVECPVSLTNKYSVVSAMVDGKQKHFYVHRLMAEAFIPNPENKPQVNHKDGNRSNNDLSNLEWVTAKENVVHAYETNLAHPFINGEPCADCGDPTNAKDKVCPDCKLERAKEVRKAKTLFEIAESVAHIDTSLLTEKQKQVVDLRKEGKTYEEIGNVLGITRQGVQSSLLWAEKRMKAPLKKADINEIARLHKRKHRLETKKQKLLSEIEFLESDIEHVEERLDSYNDLIGMEV